MSAPNEVYSTNALCGLNLISTFIPVEFEEVLFSLDPTEQKSFLSLGEDFIIVNDKTINLKGNLLFHRCNYHFQLKLTEKKGVY